MSLHVCTRYPHTVFTPNSERSPNYFPVIPSFFFPSKALRDAAVYGDDEGEGGDHDDGADEDDGHDRSDAGERDDGDEADRNAIADHAGGESDAFDDDQTTLVLGATAASQSLGSESSEDEAMEKCVEEAAVNGRDPDLSSTDNESRSPWEVTGESQKNKALRKRMELEGKAWPPSPNTYAAGVASESDDDDMPNVPASSGGDTGTGMNLHALVVPPMPPTPPSSGDGSSDDGDEKANQDYITPPKRATSMQPWSSMKTMRANDGKVKVEPSLGESDDATASWLATAVAVVVVVVAGGVGGGGVVVGGGVGRFGRVGRKDEAFYSFSNQRLCKSNDSTSSHSGYFS